uniref:Uncharacterized protein n=1 Tax=Zea mays TaxID=4577 RepID=C4J125_MAIZE|nr:unknown [Zea mays]
MSSASYPDNCRSEALSVMRNGSMAGKSEAKHGKSRTDIPGILASRSFVSDAIANGSSNIFVFWLS